MDELASRAQALLDHPPIPLRSMDELRTGADRVRRRRVRRQRLAGAVVALAVALGLYASLGRGSGSPRTVHVVVPAVTTPTTATPTTVAPPTVKGVGYQSPVVAFADATDGWLVAGGSCSNGRCADPLMRHTTDGGRTWTVWTSVPAVDQVTLDAQTQRNLGALVLVHFADPSDGWYGQGGLLWSTHDGGRSWHQVPGMASVTAVASTGGTTWVWAATQCTDLNAVTGGAATCPMALMSTPSAGDAWTETDVAASPGGDLLANDGSLWLLSAGQLWLAPSDRAATIVGPPCADEPGLSPNRLLDLGVGRIGVLCAAAAVDGNTNTMTKVVVQSTDQGARWTRFAVAPSTGWAGWTAGNGAGVALVVTDGHTLWRSTGGAWSPVFAPTSPSGEIDQLTMVDESIGFLVAVDGHGATGVWATRDGGLTWTAVRLG